MNESAPFFKLLLDHGVRRGDLGHGAGDQRAVALVNESRSAQERDVIGLWAGRRLRARRRRP